MAYYRYHGVHTKIARIFNTYGTRMRVDDGRALPTFMMQSLRGEDLTVFGDGTQTRSFCYVGDLVEGIYKLLYSEEHDPVNLGNPDEMTVLEFARKVIEVTRSGSRIVFRDLPVDDPRIRQPDISKAKRILGWEPRVRLEEGLKRVLTYFEGRAK
jgi:dTDP-glucose 4,6-dehydratase